MADEPCQDCLAERVGRLEKQVDRRADVAGLLLALLVLAVCAWQAGWIRLDLPVRGA